MVVWSGRSIPEPCHVGLRMSADEFLALPESDIRYELVDGVVVMSPSSTFGHQRVAREILLQLGAFLEAHPLGDVVSDVDVRLGGNVVYRPDVLFLRSEKAARVDAFVLEPPDLVVEIVSPDSRRRDQIAKRADYEAAGVAEYWVIDPERREFRFLVLEGGAYRDAGIDERRFASRAVAGFELDLDRVRRLF